ncbi:hypothetical protein [Flavobacterium mesophilum]|uniref:hypothetical protein n=1 Tax=Flavobacterium mesophilum TaxID=3143495 RepID=UPI0031CDE6AB
MEIINNFDGTTNEEFVQIFKEALYCRMELTNYTYPHELFDEDYAFGEHLDKCYNILYHKINELAGADFTTKWAERLAIAEQEENEAKIEEIKKEHFSNEDRQAVFDKKKEEISPMLNELVDKYYQEVKITYIDL